MNVRYWQVHLLHEVSGDATFAEVIGVVADSEEAAVLTCTEALKKVQIIDTKDCGHVRFIRHTMVGPKTKTFVDGVPVDANQAPG
jgi:hypothetical protein